MFTINLLIYMLYSYYCRALMLNIAKDGQVEEQNETTSSFLNCFRSFFTLVVTFMFAPWFVSWNSPFQPFRNMHASVWFQLLSSLSHARRVLPVWLSNVDRNFAGFFPVLLFFLHWSQSVLLSGDNRRCSRKFCHRVHLSNDSSWLHLWRPLPSRNM